MPTANATAILHPLGPAQAACPAAQPAPRGGGCAFRGAKLALQPITDVAHLVHGPITCQGHSWDSRPTCSTGPRLHRATFITDLGELDIIYGGEDKLRRAVREIAAQHHPAAIFIYQTCLPAMIGDDVRAVAKGMSAQCGLPVIAVDAPGFAGGKDHGSRLGGQVLLEQVIGSREPGELTPADINVIGEYNVAGELAQIRPLLAELGIRVLASLPGDGRYHDIACAHRARAAVSLCSRALAGLAARLQEQYGIPFVEGSFYGISNTSCTLRALAGLLAAQGAPADLPARAAALSACQEKRAWSELAPSLKLLQGKRVLLATGGVKSWSLVSALNEMGLSVVGTTMHKSTESDRQRARQALGPGARLYDSLSHQEMRALLREGQADLVLSGLGSQFVAAQTQTPWLEINHHRLHALGGYGGAVRLGREMAAALGNPVLGQVRAPAPWGQGAQARV